MRAVIYTLPTCPWCDKAKKLLSLKEIQYQEVNGKSENWPTVPYIMIDEQEIGGFIELASFIRNL